jgi:hypothetical protein
LFFSMPALSRVKPGMTFESVSPIRARSRGLPIADVELLTRRVRYGCPRRAAVNISRAPAVPNNI